ncbi:oligosaccharide flippase family protein [Pirellulales bacterium]|nr:oligosaccharide flippase family protein [Pirellulales bacterium]
MVRTLLRNIVSNWFGYAIQMVVLFFLTPYLVASLGDANYGVWVLVTGLLGVCGIVDLGFRAGVTQYLTRNLAKGQHDQLVPTASSAWVAMACNGLAIGLVGLCLVWLAPELLTIPVEMADQARLVLLLFAVNATLQQLFGVSHSVFAATQRYDLANLINVTTNIARAVGFVAVLSAGFGIVAMALVSLFTSIANCLIRWWISRWLLPNLRVSRKYATWNTAWSIITFSLWGFLIRNAVTLKSMIGTLTIGFYLPMSALTTFSLAGGIAAQINQIFFVTAGVFFPAATHLDACDNTEGLRRMYLIGSKFLILLSSSSAIVGFMWAEDFFRLWIGARFVEGGDYPSVALLFDLAIIPVFIATGQRIGNQVLMGQRRVRQLSLIAVTEAVLSVVLCAILIEPFGLIGVAIGLLIPAVAVQGILHPIIVCKGLEISGKRYLATVWLRPLLVAVLQAATFSGLRNVMPSPNSWFDLAIVGLVAGGVSICMIASIGLNASERHRFLFRPLVSIRRRFFNAIA